MLTKLRASTLINFVISSVIGLLIIDVVIKQYLIVKQKFLEQRQKIMLLDGIATVFFNLTQDFASSNIDDLRFCDGSFIDCLGTAPPKILQYIKNEKILFGTSVVTINGVGGYYVGLNNRGIYSLYRFDAQVHSLALMDHITAFALLKARDDLYKATIAVSSHGASRNFTVTLRVRNAQKS